MNNNWLLEYADYIHGALLDEGMEQAASDYKAMVLEDDASVGLYEYLADRRLERNPELEDLIMEPFDETREIYSKFNQMNSAMNVLMELSDDEDKYLTELLAEVEAYKDYIGSD